MHVYISISLSLCLSIYLSICAKYAQLSPEISRLGREPIDEIPSFAFGPNWDKELGSERSAAASGYRGIYLTASAHSSDLMALVPVIPSFLSKPSLFGISSVTCSSRAGA